MPEPITLALGVAIGKLLLRWAALNDTADALEDARAGFNALESLRSRKATDPVSAAITDLLEQRLAGVRDEGRRDQMRIAVLNVAGVFTRLTDADIVAAAQHPQGFPGYLAAGPGRTLLTNTEEALTPFSRQVMDAGAAVFAELAPRSGRFTAGALVRLLDQVDTVTADVTGLHEVLLAARVELTESIDRVAGRVDALHPKVDRMLELTEGAHLTSMVINDHGTGYQGGYHVHNYGERTAGRVRWELLPSRGQLFELRNTGDAPAHEVAVTAKNTIRFDPPEPGETWEPGTGHELLATGDNHTNSKLADLRSLGEGTEGLAELRARADTGEWHAQNRLAELLAARGDEDDALTELRARADAGNDRAQELLAELLATRGSSGSWQTGHPTVTVTWREESGERHTWTGPLPR